MTTTPTPTDFWHCLNLSSLHSNITSIFPDKVLPVLDHCFSLLGALINIFFMLTIYVRGKRLGTTPLSSIFYAFICLANFIECVNSIVIHRSKQVAHGLDSHKINYYLYVASGIEDVIHFVRIGLFLPVYVIRLMYVLMPQRFNAYNTTALIWDKVYCIFLCIVGCVIGSFRTYARIKIAMIDDDSQGDDDIHMMEMVSFVLILINVAFHLVSMVIFLATILCLVRFYFKVRCVETRSEPDDGNRQGFLIIDRSNVILNAIKPALQLLTLLFITELVFHSYLSIISFASMKIYFTPGCYPEIFVKIRNFLGTPTNFVYSYHCLGVLHGVTICVIFFLQNTMKQTVRFMWRVGGLLASFSVEKLRASSRGESQRVPSFYSVIGNEDTI